MGQNLGRGFFMIKACNVESVRALLLLTPYRSALGLCIFQRWVAGFDPEVERGIAGN
jgi:hypothetical protein